MLVIGLAVALDQATKLLIQRHVPVWGSVPLLPGVLHLTHVRNTGIAFSLFTNSPTLVTLLAAATALLLYLSNRERWQRSALERIALGMILGGAIGNLIDRLRAGYVVDFIDLRVWPVFNAADASIVVGGVLLALALARAPEGMPRRASKQDGRLSSSDRRG